jgi:hypothetical protein
LTRPEDVAKLWAITKRLVDATDLVTAEWWIDRILISPKNFHKIMKIRSSIVWSLQTIELRIFCWTRVRTRWTTL